MKKYVYAIFLLIFLYLLFFSIFRINDCDEGYILTASMRISRGEMPYKDFFLHTPPIAYYTVAAAFKIFGQQLIVGRILTAIIGLLIALALYLISGRLMPLAYALIPPLIFMFWGTGHVNIPSFAWFGLLFALVAVYFFIRFLETETAWFIFLAGIFASASFMSKQNLGLCALMVFLLFLVIDEAAHYYFKLKSRNFFKNIALLFLAFVLPVVIIAYLFYLKNILPEFLKYNFFVAAQSGRQYAKAS